MAIQSEFNFMHFHVQYTLLELNVGQTWDNAPVDVVDDMHISCDASIATEMARAQEMNVDVSILKKIKLSV